MSSVRNGERRHHPAQPHQHLERDRERVAALVLAAAALEALLVHPQVPIRELLDHLHQPRHDGVHRYASISLRAKSTRPLKAARIHLSMMFLEASARFSSGANAVPSGAAARALHEEAVGVVPRQEEVAHHLLHRLLEPKVVGADDG